MNLEFMCCILYGLSDIFNKDDLRKLKRSSTYYDEENTYNISVFDKTNNLNATETRLERTHTKEKSLLPNEIRK